MKEPDVNMIKFFCTVALLIFGRKDTISSNGQLQPYNAKEAYAAIEHITNRTLDKEEAL